MRPKDTLRFLFPAVFAVLAIGALVAASVFQSHMLGTGGSQAFPPAPIPTADPPSPSPIVVEPSPVAVPRPRPPPIPATPQPPPSLPASTTHSACPASP